jgi:excisionase family DNA binding protein
MQWGNVLMSATAPVDQRDPDQLIDAQEVAVLMGVSPDYVWSLARRGKIPYVPVGERKKMFRRGRILAWFEEIERGP